MAAVIARLERLERAVAARRQAAERSKAFPSDPVALARLAGLKPDPWQIQALTSRAQTLLLCCSRQVGKSSMVAVLIVTTLLQGERTVVIVSPSERQSKELLRKVLTVWRKIGRPVPYESVTRTSLELANHSRLEAFPANEDTIRGVSSVDLLIAEEAAMVDDALFNSVSPMLAVSGGRLLAPSTPKGQRGWWYGLWSTPEAEDPDIERVEVTADQCPRISPLFLARERRRIGERWYRQEYMCGFEDAEGAVFRGEDFAAAYTDSVNELDLEVFKQWAS